MQFVKENPEINPKLWLSKLKSQPLNNPLSKKMAIYEYLYNNGYQKVAEEFQKESELEEDMISKYHHEHAELKGHILSKLLTEEIDVTIDLIESQLPDFFKTNCELLIELHLLEFIRIIKLGDYEKAMNYARKHFIGLNEVDLIKHNLKEKVQNTLTLLAYKDLSKFPNQSILSKNNIYRVSNMINKKLSGKKQGDSKLERTQALIKYGQKNLNMEKRYAKIEGLSPLKLSFQEEQVIQEENTVVINHQQENGHVRGVNGIHQH